MTRVLLIFSALQLAFCGGPSIAKNAFVSVEPRSRQHGEEQMEMMVRDRPLLNSCIAKEDFIWNWMVNQYAKKYGRHRIFWNNSMPDKPPEYDSDSSYPTKSTSGFIRLRQIKRDGTPIDCERLVRCVVFEFYNIKNGSEFLKIHNQAIRGQLTEEEYVHKNTLVEFQTMKRTTNFYEKFWKPDAISKGRPTHPRYWYVGRSDSYERFMAEQSANLAGYPWNSWGDYFRTKIAPYLRERSQAKSNTNDPTQEGGSIETK